MVVLKIPENIRGAMKSSRPREYWRVGRSQQGGGFSPGFTLIELMIVVSIIMILIGIAAGMYQRSVQRAKEATLKSDLSVMRQAIDHYTLDKEAPLHAGQRSGTAIAGRFDEFAIAVLAGDSYRPDDEF